MKTGLLFTTEAPSPSLLWKDAGNEEIQQETGAVATPTKVNGVRELTGSEPVSLNPTESKGPCDLWKVGETSLKALRSMRIPEGGAEILLPELIGGALPPPRTCGAEMANTLHRH